MFSIEPFEEIKYISIYLDFSMTIDNPISSLVSIFSDRVK